MKFYCIGSLLKTDSDRSIHLLKAACESRKMEFVLIEVENFDYTHPPVLKARDMLYRVSTSPLARTIEAVIMRKDVATFYGDPMRALWKRPDSFMLHSINKFSIPKTIPRLSQSRDLLRRYVEYVGGFPVIVKALGGSHGVGVMRADSFSSLFSMIDYILARDPDTQLVMREFIDFKQHARLIVLGKKVVESIEYMALKDDFRTNAGEPNVVPRKFPKAVFDDAIKSVHALGLEFGGVDALIDKKGKHYIIETNFPCFFPRAQFATQTDIAGMMVDYLVAKASVILRRKK